MLRPIGDLVDSSVNRQGIARQVEASQVLEAFHRIIKEKYGPKILDQVQAKSLKNKVINVAVLGSVIANELRLYESEIVEKINAKYKKNLVEKLRFFI